jgi:hypothetical protein
MLFFNRFFQIVSSIILSLCAKAWQKKTQIDPSSLISIQFIPRKILQLPLLSHDPFDINVGMISILRFKHKQSLDFI